MKSQRAEENVTFSVFTRVTLANMKMSIIGRTLNIYKNNTDVTKKITDEQEE